MKPRRAQSDTSSSMRTEERASLESSPDIRSCYLARREHAARTRARSTSSSVAASKGRQFPLAPGECQLLVEDAAALELDADVEAEDAGDEARRLVERSPPEGDASHVGEREGERAVERAQRAEVDR